MNWYMCIDPLLTLFADRAKEKAVELHLPASACLSVRQFLSCQLPQVGHCPCKADVFKDVSSFFNIFVWVFLAVALCWLSCKQQILI